MAVANNATPFYTSGLLTSVVACHSGAPVAFPLVVRLIRARGRQGWAECDGGCIGRRSGWGGGLIEARKAATSTESSCTPSQPQLAFPGLFGLVPVNHCSITCLCVGKGANVPSPALAGSSMCYGGVAASEVILIGLICKSILCDAGSCLNLTGYIVEMGWHH